MQECAPFRDRGTVPKLVTVVLRFSPIISDAVTNRDVVSGHPNTPTGRFLRLCYLLLGPEPNNNIP